MTKSKKSQVTLFIIIGILILISVGSFIYFKTAVTKAKLEPETIITREIPEQINPVNLYIEAYIKDNTKQAIKQLSLNGGYINTNSISINRLEPTEGEGIEFIPETNDIIPYWHYLSSRNQCGNDCKFDSMTPQLTGKNSVEEQLEEYIISKLGELDFTPLQQQGFKITPVEKPKSRALIRERDAVITVRYPLKIKTTDTEYKLQDFQIILPTSLSEFYEMAKRITEYESNNCFIGRYVGDVYLPAFYWKGKDIPQLDLPPISEVKIGEFKTKFWVMQDVKNRMKEEIGKAVSKIGIYNTANFHMPYADPNEPNFKVKQGLYYQQIFQPFDKYYNTDVTLTYNQLFHDIYLNIHPNNGGLLMPTDFKSPIPLFQSITQTKVYEFSYDYSFPVIIELRKDSEEEEVFRFALESNIRGNSCYNSPIPIVNSISLADDISCDTIFAKNSLNINVMDTNNDPIENAEVTYTTTGEGLCQPKLSDSKGIAEINYPSAIDTLFIITKNNYISKGFRLKDISTTQGPTGFASAELNNARVILTPIVEKDIEFRLLPIDFVSAISKNPSAKSLRLTSYEQISEDYSALIELTRIPVNGEDEFTSRFYYDKGTLLPEKLSIAEGEYDILIQLFLNKKVILPEEHNRICAESGKAEAVGSAVGGVSVATAGCAALDVATAGVGGIACAIIAGEIGSKVVGGITGLFSKCQKKPINPNCLYPGPSDEEYEKGDCYKEGYKCEGSCEVDQEIALPETDLGDRLPLGGAILKKVKITKADLEKDKIIFYVIKQNAPSRFHHLRDIGKYEELSSSAQDILLPDFN